jgi:cytidine deaminase
MHKEKHSFEFEVYNSIDMLIEDEAGLLNKAREVTTLAYAPYSNFKVGAAAKLANGEIVVGSNQENASFPVGICAERVLLAAASTIYPKIPILTMAISYHNINGDSSRPISPCGMCRQSLQEYQAIVNHPIKLILSGMKGEVYIIESANQLLPLSFTSTDMG